MQGEEQQITKALVFAIFGQDTDLAVFEKNIILQRFVLRPFIQKNSNLDKSQIAQEIGNIGIPEFIAFIRSNGLQQLWRQFLENTLCDEALTTELDLLKSEACLMAANTLMEENQLRELFEQFKQHSIPAFVFKGGQLRRTLYKDPSLRPTSDIDLFIPESRKFDAAQLLSQNGFELFVDSANISHEVSCVKKHICIDLHWHLFRPGRAKSDLSPYLFENREQFSEGLWGLNPEASLLVMLIHPAFTKHLASPESMLIHMVDLRRLLIQAEDAWPTVKELLRNSGTKTAAWSSLKLLHLYSNQDDIAALARELQPGYLHRRYLESWIERDLVRRWFSNRGLIRFAFSLALQDSVSDATIAVRSLLKARSSANQLVDKFNEIANSGT